MVPASPARADEFAFYHENVLGTSLELAVAADNFEAARGAEARVLNEIDRLSSIYSGYDDRSEFSRWQRAAVGRPVPVSHELFEVLAACDRWGEWSNWAFDPRVESLTQLWARCATMGRVPSGSELAGARARMGRLAWQLDYANRTAERRSDCPLSLNGIAKGHIVELACDAALRYGPGIIPPNDGPRSARLSSPKSATELSFAERRATIHLGQPLKPIGGVRGAMLNLGGDLCVRGDLKPTIGIAAPWADSESSEPLVYVNVANCSVATSGNSQRGFRIQGHWYSHVFDPRTGLPVEDVSSATVIANQGIDADVLAKVFNVLAPSESVRLANSLEGVACLVVSRRGELFKSDRWHKYERAGPPANAASAPRTEENGNNFVDSSRSVVAIRLGRTDLATRPTEALQSARPSVNLRSGGRRGQETRAEQNSGGYSGPTPPQASQPDTEKAKGKLMEGASLSWPRDFELVVNYEINRPDGAGGRYRRPYVAIWVENKDGFQVRTLVLWVSFGGAGPFQWLPDLKRWYKSDRDRKLVEKKEILFTVSRPTRQPGKYKVIWDGKDNSGKQLGGGEYTVCIDAAREHGTYQSIRKPMTLAEKPFSEEVEGNVEIKSASIEYRRKAPPK
jgi:thiamine biosynthesis lipoprotein ApbE